MHESDISFTLTDVFLLSQTWVPKTILLPYWSMKTQLSLHLIVSLDDRPFYHWTRLAPCQWCHNIDLLCVCETRERAGSAICVPEKTGEEKNKLEIRVKTLAKVQRNNNLLVCINLRWNFDLQLFTGLNWVYIIIHQLNCMEKEYFIQ